MDGYNHIKQNIFKPKTATRNKDDHYIIIKW